MRVKPYTLSWWLLRLEDATMLYKTALRSKEPGSMDLMFRYTNLMRWIHRRIVRKYGETR